MKLVRLGEFRVLTLRELPPVNEACETPERALEYWKSHVASDPRVNPEVECLVLLCLSTRRKILGHHVVSTGSLDTILVHPREVYRPAIVASAAAIVIMHNHPSGDPAPSEADVKVTRDLIRAGQLLKIDLVDHVIVGKAEDGRIKEYASLREMGYFYS